MQLEFYLDGNVVRTVDTDYQVRFIKEDFNVGGHSDPSKVTGGEVTTSFVGTIKDVKINGDQYDQTFDIFEEMWGDNFPGESSERCYVSQRRFVPIN